jgi:hemoglobin
MRTLWVCIVAGGDFQYTATRPGSTLSDWKRLTASSVFLQRSSTRSRLNSGAPLDTVKVPDEEKQEVLAAFSAHKSEVTAGYAAMAEGGR